MVAEYFIPGCDIIRGSELYVCFKQCVEIVFKVESSVGPPEEDFYHALLSLQNLRIVISGLREKSAIFLKTGVEDSLLCNNN